jgi:hypothetical protein
LHLFLGVIAGVKTDPFGVKPGPFGVKSIPFGVQTVPFGVITVPFGVKTGPFGVIAVLAYPIGVPVFYALSLRKLNLWEILRQKQFSTYLYQVKTLHPYAVKHTK